MTIQGTIHGKTIELLQPLPFADGQRVTVSVIPEAGSPPIGSPAAILEAMRRPPHVDPETVDLMERLMAEGRLPATKGEIFEGESGG